MPRIFERFEQVVSARRRTGFGISLWLVRPLIEVQRLLSGWRWTHG
jgi:signal transduction histidine kinase